MGWEGMNVTVQQQPCGVDTVNRPSSLVNWFELVAIVEGSSLSMAGMYVC